MSKAVTSVTRIGNDLSNVSDTVDELSEPVEGVLNEQDYYALKTALTEMLVNAIEHGNLGITFQEKKDALESNSFSKLLVEKLAKAEQHGWEVSVTFSMNESSVTYIICDQGVGFDPSILPDLDDPESMWLENGRGIQMSKALVDEVSYNSTGNEVTLVKYFTDQPVETTAV
jgi:anti-sigma regulatory factor (Ser/Thr protein kinase)